MNADLSDHHCCPGQVCRYSSMNGSLIASSKLATLAGASLANVTLWIMSVRQVPASRSRGL
jgi:DNA-binding transcriptional regulator YdaS (Cro superfamily)